MEDLIEQFRHDLKAHLENTFTASHQEDAIKN